MKPRGIEWTRRRAAYWATHDQVCVKCGYGTRRGDSKKNLVLHHVKYGARIGSEKDAQLMGLCRWCHDAIHRLVARTGWPIHTATYRYVPGAERFIREAIEAATVLVYETVTDWGLADRAVARDA